jgi:F-type H+-transporting ATPase subunit alpha
MVEILKQGQYEPLNVTDQVLVIYAGTRGHLDKIPTNEVAKWEKEFLAFMADQRSELRNELATKKDLTDDIIKKIEEALAHFQAQYSAGATSTKKKEREPVAV